MWPLSLWRQLFARALFVLWKEDRKYVGEILYERVCGGFLRFYNPHSEFSVKSFVMKRTKGRSWSGMLLSRVHNLHSLYSRGIFLRRLSSSFFFVIFVVLFN